MYDIDLGPDLRDLYPANTDKREDYSVLRHVLDEIQRTGTNGLAIEFGVATGETLELISKTLGVIGFDSFEGLPEDWRPEFPRGFFAGVRPSTPITNSRIIVGQFEDTLPDYEWPSPIALVHVDCDLYSSAKCALDHIANAVGQGTYIVFDEFFGYEGSEEHEEKAFGEWAQRLRDERNLRYDVIGHGREQWAIRLRESAA